MPPELQEKITQLKKDSQCTGRYCNHEMSENHYTIIDEDFDSLHTLYLEWFKEKVEEVYKKGWESKGDFVTALLSELDK